MLDLLARWNRWGTARLSSGLPRELTPTLRPFLDTPEVLTLIGPRRAGKSTVMFQIMDMLEARGVPPTAMLHLNLEEPALAPETLDATAGVALLERAYETWRAELHPKGRGWLFLDEVQRVPGWERWVRARNERDDLKIVVTGSSSALLSRDLGTLLTGRHLSFEVLPLGFAEILRFRGVERPAEPRLAGNPPELQHALLFHLRWGGFPEVVLASDDVRRVALLQQYFDDLLFKDVAMRHQVRDVQLLRALAVHLLSSTASLVSFQRLSGLFGASLEQVRTYCDHLQEAWLIELLPFYSLKSAERVRNPRKVHAIDLGLRNAVALTGSPDRGRLSESALFGALRRELRTGLHYWKGHGELDLLAHQGARATLGVQVAWEGWDREELRERELGPLREAEARFPGLRGVMITGDGGEGSVPLWRALLDPEGVFGLGGEAAE